MRWASSGSPHLLRSRRAVQDAAGDCARIGGGADASIGWRSSVSAATAASALRGSTVPSARLQCASTHRCAATDPRAGARRSTLGSHRAPPRAITTLLIAWAGGADLAKRPGYPRPRSDAQQHSSGRRRSSGPLQNSRRRCALAGRRPRTISAPSADDRERVAGGRCVYDVSPIVARFWICARRLGRSLDEGRGFRPMGERRSSV